MRIFEFISDEIQNCEYTLCHMIVTDNVLTDTLYTKRIRNISQEITHVKTNKLKKVCCLVENCNDDDNQYLRAVPNLYYY